jgi:hypothetical protein
LHGKWGLIVHSKKQQDFWFCLCKDLVNQFILCEPLFKRLNPDCDQLICFDNSMKHHARAPDGLDVSLLNLSDGRSKQREKKKMPMSSK